MEFMHARYPAISRKADSRSSHGWRIQPESRAFEGIPFATLPQTPADSPKIERHDAGELVSGFRRAGRWPRSVI